MLLGGDEIGRTQHGNNNAWCQDNEISWFDWEHDDLAAASCCEFTRRLIALRREHPVFRRSDFLAGPASSRARACPTSGGSAPDGRRMTRRDWRRGDARRSASSSTARELRDAAAAHGRAEIVDDSFLAALQRALRGRRRSAAAAGASARGGRSSSRPPTRPPSRAASATARATSVTVIARARSSCCSGPRELRERRSSCARPTACSSAPSFDFADARELVPYLRELGVSHLYLSPVAAGPRRARPTATTSSTRAGSRDELGRRGGAARARRPRRAPAWGSCSTSSRTTWPPTTRTAAGRDPELRARVLRHRPGDRRATGASSTSTSSPGVRAGGPGGLRGDPRASSSSSCARGSSTACASTTPTASPTRAATSSGCATRGVERVWVEKILEPGERLRDWPVAGTVGYEFLERRQALFVDPAGERTLTELCSRCPAIDARSPRSRTRRSSSRRADLRARGRAAARGWRLELPAASSREALASLPVYRTYVEPWSGRVDDADRDARSTRRACTADARGACCCSRSATPRRVRHALPADLAGDHGQGRRGHRLLPLPAGCSR